MTWQRIQKSREELDRYLEYYDVKQGRVKQIASIEKREFMINLCENLSGDVRISDQQKRMASNAVCGIEYEENQPTSIFGERTEKYGKEYVIYLTNVYAYRAYSKEDSLIAIAGRFKDNLTKEEKSRKHSERLCKSGYLISLLHTCQPFNPLFFLPYGSQLPEKNPKKMDKLLIQDLQNFSDVSREL